MRPDTWTDPPEPGNEDPALLALLEWAARKAATSVPYPQAWASVYLGSHAGHAVQDGWRRGPDGEPVCACGASLAAPEGRAA